MGYIISRQQICVFLPHQGCLVKWNAINFQFFFHFIHDWLRCPYWEQQLTGTNVEITLSSKATVAFMSDSFQHIKTCPLEIRRYKYIQSKVGRFISFRSTRITVNETKNKFTAFFSQCDSFLITLYLPHGVKKAKGRTWVSPTVTQIQTNLKMRNLFLNRQKAIFHNYSDSCCSQHCNVNLKTCTFNVMFSCNCPAYKKEENSNPGHFTLAVTDKLQMRRENRWEF